MTDQELRALVREAVQRHLGAPPAPPRAPLPASPPGPSPALHALHPSHAVYLSLVNVDDRCIIERDAPCSHCDYCKSHGH